MPSPTDVVDPSDRMLWLLGPGALEMLLGRVLEGMVEDGLRGMTGGALEDGTIGTDGPTSGGAFDMAIVSRSVCLSSSSRCRWPTQ